jgi:hypothetical protein
MPAGDRWIGVHLMRPFRAILGATILLAAPARVGRAAQFSALEMPNGSGTGILLSGEIAPGDEAAFHALAETLPKAVVLTTGPGGRVDPALKIGSEIRARGWSTLVPEGAKCASACSMIWLAGQTRMLGVGAQIGFHAMSMMTANGERTETHDFDVYFRRWLTDLGYLLDATATIVNTQAASVRWYNITELRANGIPTDPYP